MGVAHTKLSTETGQILVKLDFIGVAIGPIYAEIFKIHPKTWPCHLHTSLIQHPSYGFRKGLNSEWFFDDFGDAQFFGFCRVDGIGISGTQNNRNVSPERLD